VVTHSGTRRVLLGGALVAAFAAIAGTGVLASGSVTRDGASTAGGSPGGAAIPARAATTPDRLASAMPRDRLDVPAHGYDPDNAFVRQRHDYPPDTPARLGPDVGRLLFDMETVVDTVATGADESGRIHQIRHSPLTPDEQQAGRDVLQKFFDDATPLVDAALAGETSLDETAQLLMARRIAMNCDLAMVLGLNEHEIYQLFPQMKGYVEERCFFVRPDNEPPDPVPGDGARRAIDWEPRR
jgi:hypothetical protein